MINKNIEDAKKGLQNFFDKTSSKAKTISLENKLQFAYYKLGEAVYQEEYSDAKNRPEGYQEIINEIDEIVAAIEEQEANYNRLNNKTKCLNCGQYSSKDVPFCAYCGAKKIVEEPVEEEKKECGCEGECTCDKCEETTEE